MRFIWGWKLIVQSHCSNQVELVLLQASAILLYFFPKPCWWVCTGLKNVRNMQFLRSVLILFWLYSVSSRILLKKDLPRKNFWALLTDKNTIYCLLRSLYSQIQIKLHCLFHRWPRVAWLSFHIIWRNWQGRLSWTIPGCFRHAYREGYFWCRRY